MPSLRAFRPFSWGNRPGRRGGTVERVHETDDAAAPQQNAGREGPALLRAILTRSERSPHDNRGGGARFTKLDRTLNPGRDLLAGGPDKAEPGEVILGGSGEQKDVSGT